MANTISKAKEINQEIKKSNNKDYQLMTIQREHKPLNNHYLRGSYIDNLEYLRNHSHKSFAIIKGNEDEIKYYNVLAELHLVDMNKSNDVVTYKLSKLGHKFFKYVKNHESYFQYHEREINLWCFLGGIPFTLVVPVILVQFSILLCCITFLIGLGVAIYGEISSLDYSEDTEMSEKNVLGLLSEHLDSHDYRIAKIIFQKHEVSK